LGGRGRSCAPGKRSAIAAPQPIRVVNAFPQAHDAQAGWREGCMSAWISPLDPLLSRRSLLRGVGVAGLTLALGGAAGPGPRRAVAAGPVPSTQAPTRWLSPSLLQG